MFNDQSLVVWALLVVMACGLAGWSASAYLDREYLPLSAFFLAMMLGLAALRLVGLAIKQKDPTLWSQIQTLAKCKAVQPGPRKLALLASFTVLALFINFLHALV